MTAKPRKRSKPRITAAERVDAYRDAFYDPSWNRIWLNTPKRNYLLKMLRDHARETLARERRRVKAGM